MFTAFLLLFVPILSRNKTIKITDFQSVISVYPDVLYIQNVDLLVFSKSENFFRKWLRKFFYISCNQQLACDFCPHISTKNCCKYLLQKYTFF